MVLLFTNKEDVHPTNVIKYLSEWGVPIFRLNTECLLTDYEFGWWYDSSTSQMDCRLRNIHTGLEIYGNEISAIWDRRPCKPEHLLLENDIQSVNQHILKEANSFLNFLRYYLKGIYSIGSIDKDRISSSKMLQLSVAKEIGFQIPHTIFSNRKSDICKHFKNTTDIILKPIGTSNVLLDNERVEYVFYSTKVTFEMLNAQPEEAFSQTVSFSQTYIEKAYELRVTVINHDVIACKIDSQLQTEKTGKVDWRQGYDYSLKHEIVPLPKEISNKCIKYLKKLGLNFGCFDFIVTPMNEYVFLECNPNGQWLWIENYTGFDISKIIAKNLSDQSYSINVIE